MEPSIALCSNRLRKSRALHPRAERTRVCGVCGVCAVGIALLSVAGCGGSSSPVSASNSSTLRGVTISLAWPAASASATAATRALPASANSIVVTVVDSGGFTDSRTVNRPGVGSTQISTSVSFFGLAAGIIKVSALAYTGAGGVGTVVDTDETSATVGAGSSGNATINFNDVPIASVQFTPSAAQTVLEGATYTLTAAGLDATGNLVTASATGTWTSSNPSVATVGKTTGVVTALGPGTAVITFTDSIYGTTGSTSVTVQGGNSTVNIS